MYLRDVFCVNLESMKIALFSIIFPETKDNVVYVSLIRSMVLRWMESTQLHIRRNEESGSKSSTGYYGWSFLCDLLVFANEFCLFIRSRNGRAISVSSIKEIRPKYIKNLNI